jgi:hypothetical protein
MSGSFKVSGLMKAMGLPFRMEKELVFEAL